MCEWPLFLKRLKISFFLQYILTVTHDSAQNVHVYDCTQFLKKQVTRKQGLKHKCIIEIIRFCFKNLLRHQNFFSKAQLLLFLGNIHKKNIFGIQFVTISWFFFLQRLEDESYYLPEPTVHEQIDETIFACCATGKIYLYAFKKIRARPVTSIFRFYRIIFCIFLTATSSKDSLLSWVRCLEKEVPNIGNLQILFTLKQVWSPIQPISEEDFMMREYKN